MAETFRIEKDSMGEMRIPAHLYYGASTQRAVENFRVSSHRFPRVFLRALALTKAACAASNLELKKLEPKLAKAILKAAKEIERGDYDAHFVLDIFQTGSGTSTNMNFNEVAANVSNLSLGGKLGAKSPVHPNDHVNMGQSSNDVIPTALHVAAVLLTRESLLPALEKLSKALAKKAQSFTKIVKTGRTHLQDATPICLGQEFSGYETQVKKSRKRIEGALSGLYELPIGGTAVGTGINTDPQFGKKVSQALAKELGFPFFEAENHFEAQAARDACVELSGSLKGAAVSLTKIANDLRWLGSGPRCGLGELILPEVQPGSSIMPGKVNPVMAESLLQVCAQVIANDVAVTLGGQSGNFELNVMMPLIAHNLLESIEILANAVNGFTQKCVVGLEADTQKIAAMLERSLMLATPLAPVIGYEKAAQLAKKAHKENKTIREVSGELKLSKKVLDALLDPAKLTVPGAGGGAD